MPLAAGVLAAGDVSARVRVPVGAGECLARHDPFTRPRREPWHAVTQVAVRQYWGAASEISRSSSWMLASCGAQRLPAARNKVNAVACLRRTGGINAPLRVQSRPISTPLLPGPSAATMNASAGREGIATRLTSGSFCRDRVVGQILGGPCDTSELRRRQSQDRGRNLGLAGGDTGFPPARNSGQPQWPTATGKRPVPPRRSADQL